MHFIHCCESGNTSPREKPMHLPFLVQKRKTQGHISMYSQSSSTFQLYLFNHCRSPGVGVFQDFMQELDSLMGITSAAWQTSILASLLRMNQCLFMQCTYIFPIQSAPTSCIICKAENVNMLEFLEGKGVRTWDSTINTVPDCALLFSTWHQTGLAAFYTWHG